MHKSSTHFLILPKSLFYAKPTGLITVQNTLRKCSVGTEVPESFDVLETVTDTL